ncbi:MAG TPA: homoserine dehydrogenase [Clostridia bacterium]|nr:homoserine dehydrogenase [Clostridia bacterium]
MKTIKIGMIGLGTVGGGTAAMLEKNKGFINKTANAGIVMEKILVRDVSKERPGLNPGIKALLTDNPDDIFNNSEIDIVVEVMGGTDLALTYVKRALNQKKHVVTATKDMMAVHANELFDLADKNGVVLMYEASVCAAIPIVDVLKKSLAGNKISRIMGILNGTTNYILTKMDTEGIEYDEALRDAIEKGYAESNPDSDVLGYDPGRKLAILAAIAYNMQVEYDDVYIEGITKIRNEDLRYAAELGYRIKLIADAKYLNGGVKVHVNPVFMPLTHPLARVDGIYNAIYIESDMAGRTMLYGRGAGAEATASAVVGDIIAIARDICEDSIANSGYTLFNERKIIGHENAVSQFYIRMSVKDSPGVLSRIAGVLGDHNVSIYSVVQAKAHDNLAEIVMVTHSVVEKNMQNSLREISGLDIVNEIGSVIRVEGEE